MSRACVKMSARMAQPQDDGPASGERFTNYEVATNAARELMLGAEDVAEKARALPADDPRRLAMMQAAAAALTAAAPYVSQKDKRRFAA